MALDFATQVNTLQNFKREFILSPQQWALLEDVPKLVWTEVAFTKENKVDIPKKRGIYCFIIKSHFTTMPSHGYIAYIGIAGDSSIERNLCVRYGEYLRDLVRPKRPLVHMMLNTWKDDIYFHYTVVEDMAVMLSEIETKLLDAVIPPFNQNDFSGDFGRVVKAAWR